MKLPRINADTFEALQANAGADFVVTLVEAFAEEAPQLIDALRVARAQTDAEGFESAAHALKSNGVAFGAVRLAEMARHLEWQGASAANETVDELAAELTAVLSALRTLARRT